ncbi:SDR family oxidoreductase [Actinomadura barringtoniae]|uniref:SDR family oxidoreductase n=1 Tax=Actinomadura barringtoniae TaxID=1427535 RepID=A0A939TAV2_9ACTN|nr:SDR family oxidoreductase [Actinomadura barringtoniae]MBO2452872.1 SDR family oxidoreductase [Actinomadura barringtoniae]
MRDHRVRSGEVELAVRERGEGHRPTVVLVHGYPDTSAVWDEVAERLAGRFRVIAYDVRGAGASTTPDDPLDYGLDALMGDLKAVLDAAGAAEPVHLVGHDWGSVQGWEAVTGSRLTGRIASFTSISGPARQHVGLWTRETARSGPRGVAEVMGQARRSAYMPVLRTPRAGEMLARAMPMAFERGMRLMEGAEPRPGHPAPTLSRDAINGLGLYRANMGRGKRPEGEGRTDVPVQLIVPTRDRYATEGMLLSARGRASRLYVRRAPGGHWIARSHPDLIARWIGEFVDYVESGEETQELTRARAAGEAGKDFGGQLVVVTGAGSGIGSATAQAFAKAGARVVVADIDEGAAKHTADEIAAQGGDAQVYRVDVTDADGMDRFAEYVRDTFGVPDVVVNNAGIGVGGPLLDTDEEVWGRIRSTNLDGVYRGCRLFGRQMVERGEGGQLVNIASMAAFTTSAGLSAYSATKAAVLQLSECLRVELEPAGVGVTAICPGVINTPIVRNTQFVGVPPGVADLVRRQAIRLFERRGYPPERVADAILRAVRNDRAVVVVSPEARIGRTIARISPATGRALARFGRMAGERMQQQNGRGDPDAQPAAAPPTPPTPLPPTS